MWTLENKDTNITHTLSYGLKWYSFIIKTDLDNRVTYDWSQGIQLVLLYRKSLSQN